MKHEELIENKVKTKVGAIFKKELGINIFEIIEDSKQEIEWIVFENKYLTKKQKEVLKDVEKHKYQGIILSGGIGSGKTYLACYLYIKTLLTNRHLYQQTTDNFIIGDCMDSLKTHTLKQVEEICDLIKIPFIPKKPNNTECQIDGLVVNVYSGRDSDAFKKIRGGNTAVIYINEATLMNKDSMEEILRRLRIPPKVAIFDTNPDHPEHFFKKDYVNNTNLYKTYNFTIYDNPFLDKEYIEKQELAYEKYPETKLRMLMGEWITSTNSLFPHFAQYRPEKEGFDFISPIAYLDTAFTTKGDNTALCVMEEYNGIYYTYLYQEQEPVTNPDLIKRIINILKIFNVSRLYLEDRDSTKSVSFLTQNFMQYRQNERGIFRIKPIYPRSNKHARISLLCVPLAMKTIRICEWSEETAKNDIYIYTGDGKTKDDSLDAMSACYLLLNLTREKEISPYFNISKETY